MTSRRGFTLIETLVILCLLGILAALLVPLIDWAAATPRFVPGVVVTKSYQGAETHVGTGVAGNGQVVVTTSSSPERYIVIVDAERVVRSCDASPEDWAEAEKGSPVTLREWTGRIFGGYQGSEVMEVRASTR